MKQMMPMMLLMLIIVVAAFGFALNGVQMHAQVGVEELKFHNVQSEYYSQPKSVRDAADEDSELLGQLVMIQNYPSELLRLKLVGVGKILTGIFVLLFGILVALITMPMRLGHIMHEAMKKGKKK